MTLKDLKEYKLDNKKQGSYIPILDKDPVFAAKFLTIKDLEVSYKLLKEVFEDLKKGKNYYEVLNETLLYSYDNFLWFVAFFKEMENLLDVDEYSIPYERTPRVKSIKGLHIYQPFRSTLKKNKRTGKYSLKYLETNAKGQVAINNYRITYIAQNYEMGDFQDDVFPAWYLLKETTVFEQYNEKTNTRVRVEFRNGEFQYFISGASDNWQAIEDVPLEMDNVVSALLFRKI